MGEDTRLQRQGKNSYRCSDWDAVFIAIRTAAEDEGGTYGCFHCLSAGSVVWDSDFDSGDYGYEEPGIIHECHCTNCGAQITYFVPTGGDTCD